jgi:transketolase
VRVENSSSLLAVGAVEGCKSGHPAVQSVSAPVEHAVFRTRDSSRPGWIDGFANHF